MKEHKIEGDYRQWVSDALRKSTIFAAVDQAGVEKLIGFARLKEFEPGEVVMREGDASESFFLLLMGEVSVYITDGNTGEGVELTRLKPGDLVGETGLLLSQTRTASVISSKKAYLIEFDRTGFDFMVERLPTFGRRLSQALATRLVQVERRMPMPEIPRERLAVPPKELVSLLPETLILEQRVLPLFEEGGFVTVGFVDKPTRELLAEVRQSLAGRRVRSVRIAARDHDDLLKNLGIKKAEAAAAGPAQLPPGMVMVPQAMLTQMQAAPATAGPRKRERLQTSVVANVDQLNRLEPVLRQMIDVGASDLHLSAGQRPRWRIDGEMIPVPDFPTPAESEVLQYLGGLLPQRAKDEFEDHSDCDFAFALEGVARFRVNMFRDEAGVSAVFRLVPMNIPSMSSLGLPRGAQRLTDLNQGLILVCGPTGSGKSTTLGAMLDHINNTRRSHIITIEDPIEFYHESKVSMVTQREVGKNTSGFQRALRAALREDPDIVLVGELRDLETMSLAMETAQTGHLVLSTLHTTTAIGTIDRIIDMFPVEQHGQIRSTLADILKGIVNQVLCRKIGGGRVAAFETLIASSAVGNCIRTGKNVQIETIMTTNKAQGNCTMNEDLENLVRNGAVSAQEALQRTPDRVELSKRLGIPLGNQ